MMAGPGHGINLFRSLDFRSDEKPRGTREPAMLVNPNDRR